MSSAVADETRRAQAAAYVDEFLENADWHPDRIGLFGGALRYSEYGFLKRLLMKQIAKDATGDTDTSRDYEYTDWHEVEALVLLVKIATLGGAVLAMAVFMTVDGQPVPLPQILIFGGVTAVSLLLMARFLSSISPERSRSSTSSTTNT